MRFADKIVIALLALAILGALAKAVAVILLALIVIAFVVQPRETFGAFAGLMFLGFLGRYPVPMILFCASIIAFAVVDCRRE